MSTVDYEVQDAVATITLKRPEAMNTMSPTCSPARSMRWRRPPPTTACAR